MHIPDPFVTSIYEDNVNVLITRLPKSHITDLIS